MRVPGDTYPVRLLAEMDPVLHPHRYVFVSVPELPEGLAPLATMREDEGLSAVVTADDADAHGLRRRLPLRRRSPCASPRRSTPSASSP